MSEAKTETCRECEGDGIILGCRCHECNGTGIETTGKFLGTLPSTPDPVTDEPHEPTITTTQGDAPSVVTGNGLRYVYAPGHDSGATVTDERDATIAEQAAEIERLRERVNGLEQLHASWADGSLAELTAERDALRAAVDHLKGERDTLRSALEIAAARSDSQNASISYFEQESASHNAALAEATTERDVLRLENQRLKDLSFEAQDRYAALEAERDELETANATLRMLNESVDNKCEENRIRAEKYLAVIRAKDAEIAALGQAWKTSMATGEAMQEAGLKFRHVSTEIPPFATEDTES